MHAKQWPGLRLQATQMDASLTFFTDAVGGCERILRTPIPLSYTRCAPRPPSLLTLAPAQPSVSACRARAFRQAFRGLPESDVWPLGRLSLSGGALCTGTHRAA